MSLEYSDLDLHNYLNTRPVFAGLDVSDLAKAAVIGNLGMLLAGGKGTGKSQLANDIFEGYFGGAKRDGGQGIMIRCHPEVDIYNEIFKLKRHCPAKSQAIKRTWNHRGIVGRARGFCGAKRP